MIVQKVANYGNRDFKPIKLTIDLITFDVLCRYILQSSTLVKMEHLVNLRKMITILDTSTYENDPEKFKRVRFILKGLEARLDNNINDREIILSYINGGLTYKIDFLDYDHLDLSKNEVMWIHKMISETLQYQFLYLKVDDIQDVCTRFKTSDYSTRGNIVQEMESLIDELKNNFRKIKTTDNVVDMTFSLKDGVFQNAITDTYNIITNPSRRLITGMQGLNEMLGGGFECGRTYMILGETGAGKSVTLLNLIYQIKRYNNFYKPKDPTKTPAIVLLTMENSVVETITRLFDLVIENSKGMANYSVNDVINMLRTEGELFINDSSPIDIVVVYKPNRSVNTSYLYTLYDELFDQGYEMICLVQDHIKRIRSIESNINSEARKEYGDIVNEFKVFAIDKDVPVITNSHLNRDASKIIEEQNRKKTKDVGKLLGKSNTGESMLMADNLDCGIIITKDYDKDENLYMTFNLIKMRDKTKRVYIAQPFAPESTIRLLEDVGGIPQFKESLHMAPELKRNSVIKLSGASSMYNDINDLIEVKEDDIEDNAFTQKSYSLTDNEPKLEQPVEFGSQIKNDMISEIQNMKSQLNILKNNDIPPIKKIICPIEFAS